MSKQSSIDWLYSKMYEHRGNITVEEFEQAKAMHRKEIELFGALCCVKTAQKNEWSLEKLYNETFGG